MNGKYETIDEYIAAFPANVGVLLQKMRQAIHEAAPAAAEAISYQMPTFKLNGNLVHFAAYKNHIGFYPAPSGIERFKTDLTPYKWSKGAIQFPVDEPLPLELVKKIVAFRVSEASQKKPAIKKPDQTA
jgi:uncharacterized protein YdhG (YjbR/CyaY superfamily)